MIKECSVCGGPFKVKASHADRRVTCSRACSKLNRRNTLADFKAQIDRRGPNECWPFMGNRDVEGYGRMMLNGKYEKAHRLAFEMANGSIPEGLVVCHTCDNPPCCNPAHLFAGTNRENMDDMLAKGRSCRGERNRHCKITAKDVIEIRAWREIGAPNPVLAEMYGLTPAVISKIGLRKIWRHVA